MKNIVFVLLAILAVACAPKETKTTIRFHVSDYNGTAPRLEIGYLNKEVPIDPQTGEGVVELDLQAPTYAEILMRKYDKRLCFLEPGKDLELTYSMKEGEKQVEFGGALADEAKYLDIRRTYGMMGMDFGIKDVRMLEHRADSVLTESLELLEKQQLTDEFKEWEKKRAWTNNFASLLRMLSREMDTVAYLDMLKGRQVEDSTYLSIPAYREMLDQYVRLLVRTKYGVKRSLEGTDLADARLDCIFSTFSEPSVVGFLVDKTLFHLGEQGIERYEQLYNQYVKDPERLALFAEACKKADRIAPGQPCPDFTFKDENGKEVSLADLQGKFVYIDMWATWCGPCKGEMPSLLKLEEEFAGQDILFVSLSIDRNKDIELWKRTIKEMGLGGIQLHLGENWDWLKNFMPASMSVPRFVLLDREGKIINANMSRPSDKATAEKFRELLNL